MSIPTSAKFVLMVIGYFDIHSLRKDARAALLSSKRAIDSQSMSQREELLRSSVLNEKQDLNEKAG